MPLFRLKKPWIRKPPPNTEIDWAHPILQRNQLRHFFVNPKSGTVLDLAKTSDATPTGAISDRGQFYFPGTTGNTVKVDTDGAWTAQDYTIITRAKYESGGGVYPALWGKGDASSGESMLRENAAGSMEWYSSTSIGTFSVPSGYFTTACRYNNSGAVNAERYKLYLDGVNQNVVGAAANPLTTTKRFEFGNADSGVATNRAWSGYVDYVMVFFNPLSPEDIATLSANPYQLLKPQSLWVQQAVTGDTTAPVLTNPTGVKTGSTTATGTVDTDEANGTTYRYTSQSATPPSVADHKTGSGADAFQSLTVSATGTIPFTGITGLTASTTYYNHYLHTDAAANDSTQVTSASFTTDAAGITGTGIFSAAAASLAGIGIREISSTGSLVSALSALAGLGTRKETGNGSLLAGGANLTGLGSREITVLGNLAVGNASLAGVGILTRIGSGSLVAGLAGLSGSGSLVGTVSGSGALVCSPATMSGVGVVPGGIDARMLRPIYRPILNSIYRPCVNRPKQH